MTTKCFIILLFLSCLSFSQDKTSNRGETDKRFTSIHVLIGGFQVPTKSGFSTTFNIQLSKINKLNFGLDLMSSSYDSPDFKRDPNDAQISNYNPEIDAPYTNVFCNGDITNRFNSISVYGSKFFKINNGIYLDIQAGPSLVFIKKRLFEYAYSPGFSGTFSGGGSSPSVRITSTRSSQSTIGLYLRVSAQFKFGSRTVMELSPFSNINSQESVFGLQLGCVFGRSYKTIFLNQ